MRHWHDEKGLTLLEVVIAILILATALVPMLNMFDQGLNFYKAAGEQTLVVGLAQGIMEEQLAKSFEALQSEGPRAFQGFSGYQYEVLVSPYSTNKHLKQVTVWLLREENPGKPEVELTTLVAER